MKFKSQVLTQASGSIGGVTYSHNRGGMYQRARSIPTNPNTTRQQVVRTAFTTAVQSWNSLTDVQRDAWRLYANNVPVLNTLGDPINLTGQQMFIRTNALRISATQTGIAFGQTWSLPSVLAAPTTFNTGNPVTAFDALTIAAPGTGDIVIPGTRAAADDDGDLLLFAGRPQNLGVAFYKGPYQLTAVEAIGSADTAFSIDRGTGDWISSHVPAAAMWQPLRILVAYDDGRVSESFEDIVLYNASSS